MMGKRTFEKYYPFFVPFFIVVIYHVYANTIPDNLITKKLSDWLTISLTLSGISLGFLGTMIGAVLSIVNSKVMRVVYSQNADKFLMSYIRIAAVVNVLVLLFSIILIITSDAPSCKPQVWFLYPWLFFFTSGFLCSYRIIHLLFILLEAVNNENRSNQQAKKKYTPDYRNLGPPKNE